ncbi:MAG TPA: hypothetical protein VEQ58_06075 [Polyangiaceae bacterium]|nr:hypothetical protein [Polyangiaceae bacterium]
MRGRLVWLWGCAALGCGSSPAPAPSVAPAHSVATTPSLSSAALQKTFTGQAEPSLVVENGLPIAEHVFVDWVHLAVLLPATSKRFELAQGTHTITCADSTDPDDRPAAITEAFEAGYAYVYSLRASR